MVDGAEDIIANLHSGRLVPLLAVKNVLVLVDGDQLVAGHIRQPDVAGLVSQHLVVDCLSLLNPALAPRHVVALDVDDVHLVLGLALPVLPGDLLGASKGLLGGGPDGPVPHVGVLVSDDSDLELGEAHGHFLVVDKEEVGSVLLLGAGHAVRVEQVVEDGDHHPIDVEVSADLL